MKIKELIKEIKGVFVLPKKQYYFGKLQYGTPYFWPRNFNKNILFIRKLILNSQVYLDSLSNDYIRKDKMYSNLPMVRRSKYWIVFDYYIEIGWPISINKLELGWKDKFNSPRFEWIPSFQIFFFHWQFCIFWNAPDGNNDLYYEMILQYLKYSNKNIKVAENNWGWINMKSNTSTWNDKYLITI